MFASSRCCSELRLKRSCVPKVGCLSTSAFCGEGVQFLSLKSVYLFGFPSFPWVVTTNSLPCRSFEIILLIVESCLLARVARKLYSAKGLSKN